MDRLTVFDQPIKFVERENFANLLQLTWLILSNNEIEFLSEEVFVDLPELKVLGIERTRIKKLPEKIFNSLRNIQQIFLNYNQIEHLSKDLFIKNFELNEIGARFNPFKTIAVDFSKIANLETLLLVEANCVDSDAGNKLKILEVQAMINQNCTALAAKRNRLKNKFNRKRFL